MKINWKEIDGSEDSTRSIKYYEWNITYKGLNYWVSFEVVTEIENYEEEIHYPTERARPEMYDEVANLYLSEVCKSDSDFKTLDRIEDKEFQNELQEKLQEYYDNN